MNAARAPHWDASRCFRGYAARTGLSQERGADGDAATSRGHLALPLRSTASRMLAPHHTSRLDGAESPRRLPPWTRWDDLHRRGAGSPGSPRRPEPREPCQDGGRAQQLPLEKSRKASDQRVEYRGTKPRFTINSLLARESLVIPCGSIRVADRVSSAKLLSSISTHTHCCVCACSDDHARHSFSSHDATDNSVTHSHTNPSF